jgi:hypothetical protein
MNTETQKNQTAKKPKTLTRGKKLNSEILSCRNGDTPGCITRGRFLSLTQMTRQNGEPVQGNFDQDLYTMELADLETGEIKRYWADGGIRGTLKMANVQPDTAIEIEHTGKKKIEEGTVQTYDVYILE